MNKKVIGGYVCVDLEGHYYIGSSGDIKSRRIHHRLGNNHLHTRLYMTKNVRYCKTLEQARK
jgi:predicted GIY-YIG superfamily endonuclease